MDSASFTNFLSLSRALAIKQGRVEIVKQVEKLYKEKREHSEPMEKRMNRFYFFTNLSLPVLSVQCTVKRLFATKQVDDEEFMYLKRC